MPNLLQGKIIAALAADGVERVELDKPRSILQHEGVRVEVPSLKSGEIHARELDLEPAGRFAVGRVGNFRWSSGDYPDREPIHTCTEKGGRRSAVSSERLPLPNCEISRP
jgi:hypothetical protein